MFSRLATFSALVSMITLAMYPFTQQIILPVVCDRAMPHFLSKTNREQSIAAKFEIFSGALNAMILGLLSDYQMLNYSYSIGNCTFT